MLHTIRFNDDILLSNTGISYSFTRSTTTRHYDGTVANADEPRFVPETLEAIPKPL